MGQAETDGLASPVSFWSRKSRSEWATLYIRALAAAAFVMLCLLVWAQLFFPELHPGGQFHVGSFAVLLFIAVFVEYYTIRVDSRTEISAGFLVCFLSTAIVGPLASFAIAVTGQFVSLRDRQWERSLYFAATMALVTGSTSLLYWASLSHFGGLQDSSAAIVAGMELRQRPAQPAGAPPRSGTAR